MTAALILAAWGPFTSWAAPGFDGRDATCEIRQSARVEVELCERETRLVSIACRDAETREPATCPGWAASLAWRQER